jgi:tetratricopeptide (TPR) repeat protein
MDALKKAEAANKERTPSELSMTDSESKAHNFFTQVTTTTQVETAPLPDEIDEETLNLLDWETDTENPIILEDKGNFDWLNAEISLSNEDIIASPEIAEIIPEVPQFFIDEPEINDDFIRDNFALENPAPTPEFSEELMAAPSQKTAYTFTPTAVKPNNSIEFTAPINKIAEPEKTAPLTQTTPENINTANQAAAQRIFNARQTNSSIYRTVLYALFVLVLLGMMGIYAYSFLFVSSPSTGLTRYPVNNPVNISQNIVPQTSNGTQPNHPHPINNSLPPAEPAASTAPVNSASNLPPIIPMLPSTNSTEKIEKNGVSLPNGANEPTKTLKSTQKNAALAPEKVAIPLQGTEQLTGMLSLKKDSLTHANQDLSTAYQALQQGDLNRSERAYKKVLQYDGRNRDVLLGLAAIALQQGRVAQAQHYYQQILQSYPQDSLAQAGLISSLGERSPDVSVSQLKTMLAQLSQKAENLPQLAYLQFTLGNVYARQQAWTEAQQAYFEAYRTEPRADYAYNLAISLDQLHQYVAATHYYQQALQLGQSRERSGFDRQAATQRLQELNAPREVQPVLSAE